MQQFCNIWKRHIPIQFAATLCFVNVARNVKLRVGIPTINRDKNLRFQVTYGKTFPV